MSELTERALIVSSDGHAVAPMNDYRPYLPESSREDFDAFAKEYAEKGIRVTDPRSLRNRIDEYLVQEWTEQVFEQGRHLGQGDPVKRGELLDVEGVSAEVLFPDFGLPWELHPPLVAAIIGYQRTPEQVELANKAHNRWLADFVSVQPDRYAGLAVVSFADVDDTVAEIRWAKEHGLAGVVLPAIDEKTPFFHPRHDPIWATLAELDMPANTHTAISSVTNHMNAATLTAAPNAACAVPMMTAQTYFQTQQILTHFVWGGVFERHPKLKLALTEQGTGWVVSALAGMDYSWERSYLRRDAREVVKHKPSDYFKRQVLMGSSLWSRAEAEARHAIGVDKIAIGMDYPHHEGTWAAGPGTTSYMQATLGVAGVPVDEAEKMLGGNAVDFWGLDGAALRARADRIGPFMAELLTPAVEDFYPRGDVHKPLATAF